MRDIATNLRFPERLYRDLQYAAERRGLSMASVVREAVAIYLGRTGEPNTIPVGDDPADRLIGSISHGPDDESVNHDRYLYGWPADTAEAPRRHGRAARPRHAQGSPPRGRGQVSPKQSTRSVRDDQPRPRGARDASSGARRRRQGRRRRS